MHFARADDLLHRGRLAAQRKTDAATEQTDPQDSRLDAATVQDRSAACGRGSLTDGRTAWIGEMR